MLSSLVVLGAAALHLLNAPEDDARGSWLPEGFRLPNIVHPFMPTLGKRTLPSPQRRTRRIWPVRAKTRLLAIT